MHVIAGSDRVIDIGPGAGEEGGRVVPAGPPAVVARAAKSAPRRTWRGCWGERDAPPSIHLAGRSLRSVPGTFLCFDANRDRSIWLGRMGRQHPEHLPDEWAWIMIWPSHRNSMADRWEVFDFHDVADWLAVPIVQAKLHWDLDS
ncbi:MAG TPA: hypothetical protein VFJ16_12375 [Longimicrobium sp.]|nr:hypothetical protein [Longimicrobium sp.]